MESRVFEAGVKLANPTGRQRLLVEESQKLSLLWHLAQLEPAITDRLKTIKAGFQLHINFAVAGIVFDEPINELRKLGQSGDQILATAQAVFDRRALFAPLLQILRKQTDRSFIAQ